MKYRIVIVYVGGFTDVMFVGDLEEMAEALAIAVDSPAGFRRYEATALGPF